MGVGSARMAISGIKEGTPDCLRAQDIALSSRASLVDDKKTPDRLRKDLESKSLVCSGS